MKNFLTEMRAAILVTLVLAVVCCGVYPLVVYGIGQGLFREKADGSLITDAQGQVRGSRLLGQGFAAPQYFHPRPSAAGNGWDGTSSGGSNLGPSSRKLADTLKDRIGQYRQENGLTEKDPVPADAVTASGSGLDPHISLENARLQLPRVAKARGLDPAQVKIAIDQYTQGPDWGFFGEPGVNVLELNLALDGKASLK